MQNFGLLILCFLCLLWQNIQVFGLFNFRETQCY